MPDEPMSAETRAHVLIADAHWEPRWRHERYRLDPNPVRAGRDDIAEAILAAEHAAYTRGWVACREAAAKAMEPLGTHILSIYERPGGPPGNAHVPLTGPIVAQVIRALPVKPEGE